MQIVAEIEDCCGVYRDDISHVTLSNSWGSSTLYNNKSPPEPGEIDGGIVVGDAAGLLCVTVSRSVPLPVRHLISESSSLMVLS